MPSTSAACAGVSNRAEVIVPARLSSFAILAEVAIYRNR
jgi:hypothetical protein